MMDGSGVGEGADETWGIDERRQQQQRQQNRDAGEKMCCLPHGRGGARQNAGGALAALHLPVISSCSLEVGLLCIAGGQSRPASLNRPHAVTWLR
jgi:hypothetical protein